MGRRAFPLIVIGVDGELALLDRAERRPTGTQTWLDRPREFAYPPTAFAPGSWSGSLIFLAGRLRPARHLPGMRSYETQIWIYRAIVLVLPVVVFLITRQASAGSCSDRAVERVSEMGRGRGGDCGGLRHRVLCGVRLMGSGHRAFSRDPWRTVRTGAPVVSVVCALVPYLG